MGDSAETAILAGGCFWIMQQLLRQRDGVISTRVGWTGGQNDNPTEEDNSGHAEAIGGRFRSGADLLPGPTRAFLPNPPSRPRRRGRGRRSGLLPTLSGWLLFPLPTTRHGGLQPRDRGLGPLPDPLAPSDTSHSGGGGIRTLETPCDACRFSRPVHSTALPPLRGVGDPSMLDAGAEVRHRSR
jgi:peptide methionine sulfoxide reductase